MSDIEFILPGLETISISSQDADKLLSAGDGLAALLYLYILRTRGRSTLREASGALGKTGSEITAASEVLKRLGLICYGGRTDAVPLPESVAEPAAIPASPRKYNIDEVRQELVNGTEFSQIADAAQRCLGKLLSPDELIRLFGIYDSLRLPPEVIFQLITHCVVESRAAGGRSPTMRYIEKAAFVWERAGVFTLEKAEEFIKEQEQRRSVRGMIKKALQIKDRELSASERQYVDGWIALGFGAEAVEIAYDRTVLKTGKLTWRYMDSILKSWHEKGLYKPEEILEKDAKAPLKKYEAKSVPRERTGPNQEDFERMKKFLNKLREEE